jgi:TPP-dependent pyruvate/acetoin dehydrogenase alpha subunit
MSAVRQRCAITRLAGTLEAEAVLAAAASAMLERAVDDEVAQAFARADASPRPRPEEAASDVG